jgi:hypothetical protein
MTHSDYLKSGAALVLATLGALITAIGPGNESLGDLTTQTWLVAIGTILGSGALVYIVENIVGVAGGVAKAALALLTVGIASLVVALDDGIITQGEWLTAASAAIAATGIVYQLPGPTSSRKVLTPATGK